MSHVKIKQLEDGEGYKTSSPNISKAWTNNGCKKWDWHYILLEKSAIEPKTKSKKCISQGWIH
jgi:hypothetical protein